MTALNDALKEEIHHLKMLTGQSVPNGGPMMNYPGFGSNQPHYPSNHQSMHTLMAAQQFQQLQIHSQKQQQHHQLLQQELHQQKTGDLRARSGIMSPDQNDNALDPSPTQPTKE